MSDEYGRRQLWVKNMNKETKSKLEKAGFNQSATKPLSEKVKSPNAEQEIMSEAEAQVLKARADAAAAEKAHNAEMAAKSAAAKDKPLESGIKVVSGQIIEFDAAAHSLTVKDKDGARHPFLWAGNLDQKMQKLKQWYFTTISAEKSGDYWKVIDSQYFKKPEDWPAPNKAFGNKPAHAPKNEAAIIMQSSLKVCADLAMFCSAPGGDNYESMVELVYNSAKEMTQSIRRDFP